jgi:hypothetical protein
LLERSGLRLVVEGADRLRRLPERGVVGIDVDVCEQAHNGSCGRRGELRLDQRADLRLRLGDGEVERKRWHFVGRALLA